MRKSTGYKSSMNKRMMYLLYSGNVLLRRYGIRSRYLKTKVFEDTPMVLGSRSPLEDGRVPINKDNGDGRLPRTKYLLGKKT